MCRACDEEGGTTTLAEHINDGVGCASALPHPTRLLLLTAEQFSDLLRRCDERIGIFYGNVVPALGLDAVDEC